MKRKGFIAVLLSFSTCIIGIHLTTKPHAEKDEALANTKTGQNDNYGIQYAFRTEKILDIAFKLPDLVKKYFSRLRKNELIEAENVCKIWQELARKELDRRTVKSKIICNDVFGKLSEEDIETLLQSNIADQKKFHWRAKLLLLFKSKGFVPNNDRFFALTQNLSMAENSKCFLIERSSGAFDMTLRCGTPTDCLDGKNYEITGCIFPETFLEGIDVDVIFPSLNMFQPNFVLFNEEAEVSKKMLETNFGWKAQSPIKLAIIFSRDNSADYNSPPIIYENSSSVIRAKEAAGWLRSLPEGKQMQIIPIYDCYTNHHPAATGNDKDMAIVLFGGNDIVVDNFTIEYENLDRRRDPLKLKNEKEFREWKAYITESSSQSYQRIAFLCAGLYRIHVQEYFREIFGDSIPLIMLEWAAELELASTFTIVSFPER